MAITLSHQNFGEIFKQYIRCYTTHYLVTGCYQTGYLYIRTDGGYIHVQYISQCRISTVYDFK